MPHYIGQNPDQLLASDQRFLYALRRTDEGELYFARLDQLSSTDSLTINNPAGGDYDYTGFEMGVDFFEGRDVYHELVFANLEYEQYRWDQRSLYYYINDNGELVVRINQLYTYPAPGDA